MFEGQPKGLYALALANTGERFGYYTMLAIFTLFLQAKFGFTAATTSTIFASFLAAVYFMPLIGGILADKFGYGKMVTSGIVIMFVGYLLLSIPTSAEAGKMMMQGAPVNVRTAVMAEEDVNEEIETETLVGAQPEADSEVSAKEEGKQDEKKAQLLRAVREADRRQMEENASWVKKERGRSRQNWQMSLGAGNTPYSYSNSFGGFGRVASHTIGQESNNLVMNPLSNESTAYNQVMFNNREQSSKTEVHHRMPVSVGASVKWFFTEDWALESGLFYTILSSDSRSGAESYMEEKWKLHYIGVPLKIHRSVWQNERFGFYASAGGAVEKCVSGDLETVYVTGGANREAIRSSLDVDPLQWSVMAGVGAQVNFTKQLGLYVEPGIAYYFDDGCDIETFRKEHPFSFNIQLGLRFSFLK